jgi:MoxR-like ATPase
VCKTLIQLRKPFLVKGNVGIGKTSISQQAAEEVGCEVMLETPHLKEPTDYLGFPFVQDGIADFIPLGKIKKILDATERLHVVFDELDKSSRGVMNAVAQLILSREVNGNAIPDCVSFSATGNLMANQAGSNPFPSHLVDRFVVIVELETNIDDWTEYALERNHLVEFVAFNRFKPEYLTQGQNISEAKNIVKSPTPRTIEEFGKLLLAGIRDFEILEGCTGKAYAAEYLAFERVYKNLPNIDSILLNPTKAKVPKELDVLYALTAALANKSSPANFDSVITYLDRLALPYQISTIVSAVKRNESLTNTRGFIEWASRNSEVLI